MRNIKFVTNRSLEGIKMNELKKNKSYVWQILKMRKRNIV